QTSGNIDGIEAYYSNVIAPTNFKLLTVNYYDNYEFPNAQPVPSTVEGQAVLANIKGLASGSWTRAVTAASSTAGETSTIFYDDKARPVKNYLQNYLGGYTSSESKIDFAGKTLYSITKHKRTSGNTEITVREEFTYSPQDRLLIHTHQINGGAVQLLADNTYDALGQLESKKVGNNTGDPLQKVDFKYNIRGWLTAINQTSNLQQDTDPVDLFAFKINYDTVQTSAAGVNALYNGNISETFWKTASDITERAYGYKYDNLNRLKNAVYEKNGVTTSAYDENLTYDKNGNIKKLSRKGDYDPQVGNIDIDDLVYTYTANTNQLTKVEDNSNNVSGFNDANKADDDYSYDDNGNMITDKNKNITAISYNHLNLPKKITFGTTGSIEYFYTAAGQKIEKIVTEGTVTTATNYLGGYQYKDNVLEFFPTAEGYVKNTDGALSYVFQYKDHLGNVRLSYAKNPTTQVLEIIEENNYYPFGLKHKGYNDYTANSNKYKYNGKELQNELGLNMYAMDLRLYDPAIARWTVIDPVVHFDESPYNAFSNNPVFWEDPSGASPVYNNVTGQYVINGAVATFEDALAYVNSGGNAKGDNNNTASKGGFDEELDSNFSQDGYNIYLFRATMGEGMKTIASVIDLINGESSLESTLEDGERLTKIILFKKEINMEYKDGKGNKISKNKYDEFVSKGKSTTITKTTIIKRYQGQIPTIAKQSVIDAKNIKLSLTKTTTVDNHGKTTTSKSNSTTSLSTLSSNIQLIFQSAADYNSNQYETQSGSFIENFKETTKKVRE
ncbi:RHS repeat domain-containing protein, partial [Flavobacterium sp. CGRL2]